MIFDGDVVVELLEHVAEVFKRRYDNIFMDFFFRVVFWGCFWGVRICTVLLPGFLRGWIADHIVCINIQPVKITSYGSISEDGTFSTNYFNTKHDVKLLGDVWEQYLNDFDRPLKNKGCFRILPMPGMDIYKHAGHFTTSYFHPHGSLRHLVDEEFRLEGVENVRVGDASVLGEEFGGPTALGCMGIGRFLGECLRKEQEKSK